MKQYIFFFSLLLFLNSITILAQEDNNDAKSSREKFEAANSLMEDHLYEFAKKLWLELYEAEPQNANINFKTGYCLLNTTHNKKQAFKYFDFAKTNIDERYNPYDYSVKTAPIAVYYYLGKSHHLNYKPDSAIFYFNKFLDKAGKKHFLREEVFHDIKQCEIAKSLIKRPKDYKLENMGAILNSPYSDFSPVLTTDESAIFFTSRRLRTDTNHFSNEGIYSPQDGQHFEDVYISYKNFKTNEWDEPVLADFCSPKSNQATISVSSDGQFLYIYKDDEKGNGDIYVSERDEINYGPLRKLEAVNSESWETHVTISMDGKTMYFVSDREGGYGGRDIYRCVRLPNGEWSKAWNIGPPINTPFDEDSPFLHPDGTTFYYSSNGEESMGGFDIFFSKLMEEGKWSSPINMGYPLNTVEDDLYFTTNADGKHGYYASSHEGGFGEKDIYKVIFETAESTPLAILKGYIDPGSQKTIPAGIIIWVSDLTTGEDPTRYSPNRKNGSYVFSLTPCHEYLVEYTQDNETFYETEFKLPCGSDYQEINKVITIGGIPLEEETAANSNENNSTLDPSVQENSVNENSNTEETIAENSNENNNGTDSSNSEETIAENNSNYNETSATNIEPVEFQIFYGYNEKGIKTEKQRFETFIEGVYKIIEKNGTVKIELEGSASTVPTKTYSSNKNLSELRSSEAKNILIEKLKQKGVDLKKFTIVSENSLVQGPKYKGDYKNKDKYGKFQYIKIVAF